MMKCVHGCKIGYDTSHRKTIENDLIEEDNCGEDYRNNDCQRDAHLRQQSTMLVDETTPQTMQLRKQ